MSELKWNPNLKFVNVPFELKLFNSNASFGSEETWELQNYFNKLKCQCLNKYF